MGVEVTDICMDKESDCATIYSKGVSHETISNGITFAEPYEHINGDCGPQYVEDSSEGKEYEVKECTNENIDKSNEKQDIADSDHEEKIRAEFPKGKDESKPQLSVNHASKSATTNVRTKHTVPQPFSLSTEKRASIGIRSFGSLPDAINVVNKTSNTNNVKHSNTAKKNQVIP